MSEDLTQKLPQSADGKLTLILSIVQALETRVDNIDFRLNNVEQTLDERLYDTRPIWQKAVADIAQLQATVDALQDTCNIGFGEIKKSLRDIYYRFDTLSGTMLAIQAQHRDVHERVGQLEANIHPPNSQT